MPTLRFVVRTSEGGRGKGRSWVNIFHMAGAALVTDDEVKTQSDALVAALRQGTLSVCTIDNVVIKDPAADGSGYDPAKVRTIPYGVAGQKLIGEEKSEIKEVVIRLVGACSSGRNGHAAIRLAVFDSEVVGGTDGEPSAAAEPAGVESVVTALNAMIAGGTAFHKYGKRKKGGVTDEPITAWRYGGVGYRTARRTRRKRGSATTPGAWVTEAKDLLDSVLRLSGSYQLVKGASLALRSAPVAAAVTAIEAGAETALEVLPELALL